MNENYRKKAVNVKLIFAATAMATLALSAHSLKASAVPVDNFTQVSDLEFKPFEHTL